MPVQKSDDGKKLILTHPKGSTAEVLFFGATVISWRCRNLDNSGEPVERLFVSSKSNLDGSKAIRGGIPVVFPFFGPPVREDHKKYPQHGYTRTATWTWDGKTVLDNDAGVSVKLSFDPSPAVTDEPLQLDFVLTLSEHQLSTDLHVLNAAQKPTESVTFQALFHTYIRAPANAVRIDGLTGLNYTDKTAAELTKKPELRTQVDVLKFTDSVYEKGPGEYRVNWPGGGLTVRTVGLKDVVIWNPNAEAGSKLADMEEGGWEHFVCVEPGHVVGEVTVGPGKKWNGCQILTPLS